jgi:hypothetical protein
MTYDTGAYDIVPFLYKKVELHAPKGFVEEFNEVALRKQGYG